MSPNCRPMDGRWSTDAKQKCSHDFCIFLMWIRVVPRFERIGLGKSADQRLKFWSPDQKFSCELGIYSLIRSASVILIVGLHLFRRLQISKHCWKESSDAQRYRISNLEINVLALYQLRFVTWYKWYDLIYTYLLPLLSEKEAAWSCYLYFNWL